MKPELTISLLCEEANQFARIESSREHASLFGVTDGKAIGTYVEHQFREYLSQRYSFTEGSSARGIDFPDLAVDMKVTSIKQPQSSCPFQSARQKIFGLGYSLLVFVYQKEDNQAFETGRLRFFHTVFVNEAQTADYQTTVGLRQILENDGNEDDLTAFMFDRNLPVDEIEAYRIAQELLNNPPNIGYLTISNALQWRLQYRRIIDQAGQVEGILKIL
ncbi:MAG: restriction endonuclease [Gemmatimonadetes bacterium]|nr:restriction endonuclease [Gemmatimonadota bacterium]